MSTGAVIITGDTARKENANDVLSALSDMAGDFVVATAGPDLESVLAAKGAGVDTYSKQRRMMVANLDVGGGTTNIGVYDRGSLVGTSCLDIGGRLIKIENEVITYIFPKIESLAKKNGISIKVGEKADRYTLYKVCELMAEQLSQAIGCSPMDDFHSNLYTNEGKPLPLNMDIKAITYSGGVADCVYEKKDGNLFRPGPVLMIFKLWQKQLLRVLRR